MLSVNTQHAQSCERIGRYILFAKMLVPSIRTREINAIPMMKGTDGFVDSFSSKTMRK
jgi:hypothetical protein